MTDHDEPSSESQSSDSGGSLPRWPDRHLWEIQPIRDVLMLGLIFGLLSVGYRLSLVTVPILLALLFAYLFEPVVVRLTRVRWINRQIAAAFLIVAAVGAIVVPLVLGLAFATVQGVAFANNVAKQTNAVVLSVESPTNEALQKRLPSEWLWVRDQIVMVRAHRDRVEADLSNGVGITGDNDEAEALAIPSHTQIQIADLFDYTLRWVQSNAESIGKQALSTGSQAVSFVMGTIFSLFTLGFSAFLTAFFFFFFSTGYGKVLDFWRSLIPEKRKLRAIDLLEQMDAVISGFIRGRLTIAAIQSVFFIIGYWMVGVPMPLLLGPIVGLLSIVPYLGLLGIPITVVAMALDPQMIPILGIESAWWWYIVGPFIIYQAGQLMDDYLLTPMIQGKSTGMDTPTILFASIAGGLLAGIYGVLIAIPVAACVKILLREVFWPRFRAWAEGRAKDFLPIGDAEEG